MAKNRQSLSRTIPEKVKREVRQRDGFGCIVCGSAFYQYDHLGIEFKDAETHDPNQIILLCGGCHDRKTRGALSTETLQIHANSPRCRETNFSWGSLDIGREHPEIVLGTVTAFNVKSLLTIDGEDVFSITAPLLPHGPFNVNASLYDSQGRQTLKIVDNEFQVDLSNWDAETIGTRVTVRSAPGKFDLVMRMEPPRRLVIERLDMVYKNFSIHCREGEDMIIERPGLKMKTSSATFNGCEIAIVVTGTGLGMGFGGGSVQISEFTSTNVNSLGRLEQLRASKKLFFDSSLKKQGRNEKCGCGSGKKFKYCHGQLQ
jgi:hypothetical protein